MRKITFLSFFIFQLLYFLSCANKETSQIELTFWAMGAEGEYINQLIPQFEASHPQIRVKVQSIPWTAAHEKLLTAFAGQSTPDICQLGNTWIPEFQAIGAVLELDSLIAHSDIVNKDAFFEGIWNTNVIGKKVFGIPWYVDTRLLFYRSDILAQAGFSQPPQTWNEWLEVSRKIRDLSTNQQQKYAVFFSLILNDWQVPVILIKENEGRLLRDNNCYGAFDEPATVEALRFYLSFFEDGFAIKNMTEIANIYQAFSNGLFSMMITGPWNINAIRKRAPGLDGRWSTAPMPCKQSCNSIAGGASLVIFKNSPHQEAAWKFIEFLSQPEIQVEFFRLTSDLPSVKAAWKSHEIQTDKQISAFYTQLENVASTPKITEWEQIAVKIQEHLEKVIFGRINLEKAVKQLNKDVDQILEKRRWLLSRNLILSGE